MKAENNRFKALVVFYSRTGNTKVVAEAIRERLDADLQEIRDVKDRSGILGFISGMVDVKKSPLTDILPTSVDLKNYDLIVLCSPTWGMKFAPAVTTFMESADFKDKKVFLTAVATAKMKNETFDRLCASIVSKGGSVAGTMLVKTIFKKSAEIKTETIGLMKENPGLKLFTENK